MRLYKNRGNPLILKIKVQTNLQPMLIYQVYKRGHTGCT